MIIAIVVTVSILLYSFLSESSAIERLIIGKILLSSIFLLLIYLVDLKEATVFSYLMFTLYAGILFLCLKVENEKID